MILFITQCLIFVFLSPHFSRGLPLSDTEQQIRLEKSEEIRKYLNETVEPCKDFYNFACGNWRQLNQASEDEFKKSVLLNMEKEYDLKLKAMLENEDFIAQDKIEEKVRDFYKSCQREPVNNDEYRMKLKQIVGEFGKMPLLEGNNWQEEDFNWWITVANISQKYGHNIMISYELIPNPRDMSKYGLMLGHPEFPIPLPLNNKNKEGNFWHHYVELVSQHLRSHFGIATSLAKETAQEIVDFEKVLAKSASFDRYGAHQYHVATKLRKLEWKYVLHMDLKSYLDNAFGPLDKDYVVEENESYFYNLERIRDIPKETIANYIFYKLIRQFALPPETSCLGETKRLFGNILDNMWYKRNNVKEMENSALKMFEELKSVFFTALKSKQYEWMSPSVQKYFLETLDSLSLQVLNYNETDFSREYGALNLTNTDYMGNLKAIYSLKALQKREKFHQAPTAYYDAENMHAGINYIRNKNLILIPLSILQSNRFLSELYPLAVNYGQLGTLLAHAILHAFDDEARFLDKSEGGYGRRNRPTAVLFNDNTLCFRRQYRNFTYAGHTLADSLVQSENIATNGAVRLAYQTYMEWYEKAARKPTILDQEELPDLKYKNKKLFFVSYAQSLCADIHSNYDGFVLASEYNPPENQRVITSLSNMEEFSEVFKCPQESLMNPEKKCILF